MATIISWRRVEFLLRDLQNALTESWRQQVLPEGA